MEHKDEKFLKLSEKISDVRDDIETFVTELVKEKGGTVSLEGMEMTGYVDGSGNAEKYQPQKIMFGVGGLTIQYNDKDETIEECFSDITFNEMYDIMTFVFYKD